VDQKSEDTTFESSYLQMSEPICVIFGTFQQCFVLNTSVTSILNKFIIQVAPPGDNISNQDLLAKQQRTQTYARVCCRQPRRPTLSSCEI